MTSNESGQAPRWLLPALIYAGLSTAVINSLGMLLVPSVAVQFDVPVSEAQWMLTVNLLVGAVATQVMGTLADGPHARRLLMISLAVIFAGSVVATIASDFSIFLVGRALQGLLYGTVPITIVLARRHLSLVKSEPAIAALNVTVPIGLGVGYPLTGILAALYDHRAAFAFAALFVATAAITVWRYVPAGPDSLVSSKPLDLPGAAAMTLGLAALLLWVSKSPSWGWSSTISLSLLGASLVFLSLWGVLGVWMQEPMFDFRLMRIPEVVVANAASFGLGTAMYIGLSIASLVAQAPKLTGYGLATPLMWAGFLIAPMSVGSVVALRIVRMSIRRMDIAVFLPVGAAVTTASSVLLWLKHDSFWILAIGMFLIGIGIGTGFAAMPNLIARSVAVDQLGSAVGFNQVVRTIGGALGAAVSAAVLAAHPSGDSFSTEAGITGAFGVGVLFCAAVLMALAVNAALGNRQRGGTSPTHADRLGCTQV